MHGRTWFEWSASVTATIQRELTDSWEVGLPLQRDAPCCAGTLGSSTAKRREDSDCCATIQRASTGNYGLPPRRFPRRFVMRRAIRVLLTALLLFGGAFVFAGPAVAAPAQPYSFGPDCYDWGGGYQVCTSGKGVYQENESASGNTSFKASGTYSYEILVNGQVVQQYSNRQNFVLVAKEGSTQVYHYNGKGQTTYAGTTCTWKYNFTLANGQVRHNVYESQCS